MSLAEYKQLDLSVNGPLAQKLYDRIDTESSANLVALTAPHDADTNRPIFLTPEMLSWFQDSIAPARGDALREILPRFTEISLGPNQRGFLIEAEHDNIERTKFDRIEADRNAFFANGAVHRLEEQLQSVTRDYEDKKAVNGGREANEWPPFLYVIVLVLLALPEFPLNTDSFQALGDIITPAIAYGLTVAVALGIGFSGHFIGETIKQWGARFGETATPREKFTYGRALAVGCILFSIAMGVITTVRYIYFQKALQEELFANGGSGGPDYLTIFGTVGGNLLIWLIGLSVAYMSHDIIPDFGRLFRQMKRLQKKLDHLYSRRLQARIDLHRAQANQAHKNLIERERIQLINLPEYRQARDTFDQLKSVDVRVLAILNAYRTKAGEKLRKSNPKLLFEFNDIELPRREITRQLDFPEYAHRVMEIKYA